jgi:hypothetical protein
MRWVAILGLVLSLGLLGPAQPADAYVDVGGDPQDVGDSECCYADIRSTARRVEQFRDGRFLVILVRAYDDLGEGWSLGAYLDSRGRGAADRLVNIGHADTRRGARCNFSDPEFQWIADGVARAHDDMVRCWIPVRYVDATKRVRWFVISQEGADPSAGRDRAPDTGWYS